MQPVLVSRKDRSPFSETKMIPSLRATGRKLVEHPAAKNFFWLIMDRGFRLFISLFIGSWAARYLGTENFGLLNFSTAIIGVFSAVAPLGMEVLVVRQIIQQPSEAGKWLGTVMAIRGFAATVFAFAAVGVSLVMSPHDESKAIITTIFSIGMAVQFLESGELLFQARTQMRRLVGPRIALIASINVVKVIFIMKGLSVFWFAGLMGLESAASGVVTFVLMRSALPKDSPLRFDFDSGKELLKRSWPLALSALTVIIYMKASQLFMNMTLSNRELGIFAAAIRIPETMTFIPMILASSLLPTLLKSKSNGELAYWAALRKYFYISSAVGYIVCIPLSLGAIPIIHILFGEEYRDAGPIMLVYSWSFMFACAGVARSQYLLNEGLTRLSLFFSVAGLVSNIGLNLLLIPHYGVLGSAFATVGSYAIGGLFVTLTVRNLRRIAILQILTILTPWRVLNR